MLYLVDFFKIFHKEMSEKQNKPEWPAEKVVRKLSEEQLAQLRAQLMREQGIDYVPQPRKIVFYAEEDHYNMDFAWAERVNREKEGFDITFVEAEAVEKLADQSLIPDIQHNPQSAEYLDSSSSATTNSNSADIPFDVRHLLGIPIDPALSDILINVVVEFRQDILDALIHFVNAKFIRNLKQPSVSFLNMIASLQEVIDHTEYDYIRKKYHEILTLIDERTDDIEQRLVKIVQADGDLDVDGFNNIIEEIMFELPQKLGDLYLTGLIMAKRPKSTMIICSLFRRLFRNN